MTFLDGHGIRHRGRQLGFAPSREWWADCQQAFGYFDAESTADVVTCLGCMAAAPERPKNPCGEIPLEPGWVVWR